jgi:hypothetical protein
MNRYTISVDKIRHNGDGKTRFESIRYPEFDPKTTDYYIITKRMDRMDLIAYDWYQDATLWWVIQRANNLPGGTLQIKPGTRVRIPWPLNDFEIQDKLRQSQF